MRFRVLFWILINIIAIAGLLYLFDIFGILNYGALVREKFFPGKERTEDMYLLEKQDLENMRKSFDDREHDLRAFETELEEKEKEIHNREEEIDEEKEKIQLAWDKYERTLDERKKYDVIIEDLATKWRNMPPNNSIEIILDLAKRGEDQLIIDVFLKMDEIDGEASITPYLFSLMPPDVAARLMQKYRAQAEDIVG